MLQQDSGQICLSALSHEASQQYVLNGALLEDVIFLFILPNSSPPAPCGKPTVEISQQKLIGLCKCPFAVHMLSPLRQAITWGRCTFHFWCLSTSEFWRCFRQRLHPCWRSWAGSKQQRTVTGAGSGPGKRCSWAGHGSWCAHETQPHWSRQRQLHLWPLSRHWGVDTTLKFLA